MTSKQELGQMEDTYWIARALIAEKGGYFGEGEDAKMMKKVINPRSSLQSDRSDSEN